jgi:hypothetical protein
VTAQVLLFTGVQRAREAAPAQAPVFEPDEIVEVHSHDSQRGDEFFRATVIRQRGEWVACRVKGLGDFSVHVSRIERPDSAPSPEVA